MTPAQRHLAAVAALPCAICVHMGMETCGPSNVHHCFDTVHRSDWLVIPLGYDHHQGQNGFHGLGQRAFERRYKTDELHLLAWTYRQLEVAR